MMKLMTLFIFFMLISSCGKPFEQYIIKELSKNIIPFFSQIKSTQTYHEANFYWKLFKDSINNSPEWFKEKILPNIKNRI